jgi:hypothetical protein
MARDIRYRAAPILFCNSKIRCFIKRDSQIRAIYIRSGPCAPTGKYFSRDRNGTGRTQGEKKNDGGRSAIINRKMISDGRNGPAADVAS